MRGIFAVANGGKADMAIALHMSAYDPKRTCDWCQKMRRNIVGNNFMKTF